MSSTEWHDWRPESRQKPNQKTPPSSASAERPQVHEELLKIARAQVERKQFTLMLKENEKGRFMRITEEGGKMRNSIMIPASGLAEFKKLLDEMVADAKKPLP